jgi:hypothetical protein
MSAMSALCFLVSAEHPRLPFLPENEDLPQSTQSDTEGSER